MKKPIRKTLFLVLVLPILLAACASGTLVEPTLEKPTTSAPLTANTPALIPTQTLPAETLVSPTDTAPAATEVPVLPEEANANQTREDAQGEVAVVVTPLNLGQPGETLDFSIQMDTHSVDLSMDLTQLATLSTDSGLSVQPMLWDAPMGGHHVSGTLSFPAEADGKSLLVGAGSLTLTINNVDVPARTFSWALGPQ